MQSFFGKSFWPKYKTRVNLQDLAQVFSLRQLNLHSVISSFKTVFPKNVCSVYLNLNVLQRHIKCVFLLRTTSTKIWCSSLIYILLCFIIHLKFYILANNFRLKYMYSCRVADIKYVCACKMCTQLALLHALRCVVGC